MVAGLHGWCALHTWWTRLLRCSGGQSTQSELGHEGDQDDPEQHGYGD